MLSYLGTLTLCFREVEKVEEEAEEAELHCKDALGYFSRFFFFYLPFIVSSSCLSFFY